MRRSAGRAARRAPARRVSATSPASGATISPPIAIERRNPSGNTSSDANAAATVTALNATVRPAVCTVVRSASRRLAAHELLAVAGDEQQAVVDREPEPGAGDEVEREHGDRRPPSSRARSRASVDRRSRARLRATGSSAATTPRKIQSASTRRSGNAISSARKRSRSDCAAPARSPRPCRRRARQRRGQALRDRGVLARAGVERRGDERRSARRARRRARRTTAIAGSRRRSAAAAGRLRRARDDERSTGPGRRRSAREQLERPEALGALVLVVVVARAQVRGVPAPNTAATIASTTATARIARGRRTARSARRANIAGIVGRRDACRMRTMHAMKLLDLFPDSAPIEDGELVLGGVARDRPRARVRHAGRRLRRGDAAQPGARVPRSSAGRARRLRDEGVPVGRGAASSSPRRASAPTSRPSASSRSRSARGIAGERLVVHGNNKEDELLRAVDRGRARSSCSTRSTSSSARRRPAAARFLVRVTPGIEADTHEAIKTAHHGSKFGLPPDDARRGASAARPMRRACTSTSARSSCTSARR